MRILDLTAIYPNVAVDFEGRSVAALDRALVAAGAEVTTLVLKPWMPKLLAQRLPAYRHLAVPATRRKDGGVDLHFVPYLRVPKLPERWRFGVNARLLARQVLRTLGRHRLNGFDVVHVQGFPTAPPALLVAQALGLPLAVTWRDDPGHYDPATLHPLEQRVVRETAAWLVISPIVERGLRPFLDGVSKAPVAVTPNAIDVAEIEGRLAEVGDAPGPDDRPWRGRLVGAGNLYRLKGFHEALLALALLRDRGQVDWHYTIVGDGPYRNELESLARELGLAEKVTFTGRLPHAQTLAHLRSADLFLLPTWKEAFGIVFAEAAVCGVPGIGCSENGPEMLIDHGETGLLVPPRQVEPLAEAIADRLADPEGTRRMGRLAKARIRRFTWDRTASLVLETLAPLTRSGSAELAGSQLGAAGRGPLAEVEG